MWQMGGLGPMAGQNGHFLLYAPQKIPYAMERYAKEVNRLYGVLDMQLARTGAFVGGADYSIADIAIFPWVRTYKAQQVPLQDFPQVQAWYEGLMQRPGVRRGIDVGKELRAPKLERRGTQVVVRPDCADPARRNPQAHLKEPIEMILFASVAPDRKAESVELARVAA